MAAVVFQNQHDSERNFPIADAEKTAEYLSFFTYAFVKKPGQHLLELGKTGTGKTNFLYWLIDIFRSEAPEEAIVWFDIGKAQYNPYTGESGNEILTLLYYFGAARIISLTGCQVVVENGRGMDYDIEYVYVDRVGDLWKYCKPDKINIVSIEPFLNNDVVHAQLMSEMFDSLVYRANRGWIHRPMAIFYDEIHNVWPSSGHGIYDSRKASAIQRRSNNQAKKAIQKLRSTGIRIIGSTHQWTQLYKSVRLSFEWIVPRRGTLFSGDVPDLARYNPLWRKMPTWAAYIVIPEGTYLGPFRCLYYQIPNFLGNIKYDGIYHQEV